jgi:hypothetical protein
MMDDVMTKAINDFTGTEYEVTTNMFLKFSGTKEQVKSCKDLIWFFL